MAGALGIGLLGVDNTDIIEELMPETGIEQMQRGVLHTAVVPIHGAPVLLGLAGEELLVVVGIHIAQVIPAGTGPVGHGVSLTVSGAAALGASGLDPVGHLGQGALTVVGGLIALHVGQQQRQLALIQRHPAALGAVHQRNGLAPVTLTGKDPVAELVVDLLLAPTVLDGVITHGGDSILNGHAVEELGVDHDAGVILQHEGFLGDIAALDHLDDGQAELGGKLPVALVMTGHAHDDTGTVAHEDVVGNKHGNGLAIDGVIDLDALETDTGLLLVQLTALEIGLAGSGQLIGSHLVPVADLILPLLQHGMLGRDDHVGDTKDGVHTGGVDGDIVAGVGLEGSIGTVGAADPVLLLHLDALDVIQLIQIVDQAIGVLGDGQHPLALLLTHDLAAAALALTFHHFLVGQTNLAAGAPVDGHGGLVGKTLLIHLQEDPLGPLVVLGVGGVHHAVPIETVTQHLQLTGEVGDVVAGHDGGMDVVLDGEVLGGQTECVIADGEEHIVTLHTALTADDIDSRKGTGMAHMEACGTGIGELDEAVELRTALITGDGSIGLADLPVILPFLLNGRKIVMHSIDLLL